MVDAKPLAKMNKTELLAIVDADGILVEAGATVPVIIAAIEAHRAAQPATSQAEPTLAHPQDDAGRALDQWGLPFSGPARARVLKALGRPDPHTDLEAWANAAPATTTEPAADQAAAGNQS